jgi:hypothetical protein
VAALATAHDGEDTNGRSMTTKTGVTAVTQKCRNREFQFPVAEVKIPCSVERITDEYVMVTKLFSA